MHCNLAESRQPVTGDVLLVRVGEQCGSFPLGCRTVESTALGCVSSFLMFCCLCCEPFANHSL